MRAGTAPARPAVTAAGLRPPRHLPVAGASRYDDRYGHADRGGLGAGCFIPDCLSPASYRPGTTRPPRPPECPAHLFQDDSMGKKLYVGNLSYDVDASALEQMFAAFGTVTSAQVIVDRDTGRSKGFGFVEMGSDAEAQAAIAGMNGKQMGGRSLTVNEARPKEDRGGRGGSGGGGRGGYGGGGG